MVVRLTFLALCVATVLLSQETKRDSSPQMMTYLAPIAAPVSEKAATKWYIKGEFEDANLRTDMVLAVVRCESRFDTDAVGDSGNSYGAFQIHLPSHPDITPEEAMDLEFATDWAIEKWQENPRIWTCYRNIYG